MVRVKKNKPPRKPKRRLKPTATPTSQTTAKPISTKNATPPTKFTTTSTTAQSPPPQPQPSTIPTVLTQPQQPTATTRPSLKPTPKISKSPPPIQSRHRHPFSSAPLLRRSHRVLQRRAPPSTRQVPILVPLDELESPPTDPAASRVPSPSQIAPPIDPSPIPLATDVLSTSLGFVSWSIFPDSGASSDDGQTQTPPLHLTLRPLPQLLHLHLLSLIDQFHQRRLPAKIG